MPEISRFYGIIIAMYYEDHHPSHFHVRYGSQKATVTIESLSLLEGSLPARVLGMVIEWATLHKQELEINWELAQGLQVLKKIEPLA